MTLILYSNYVNSAGERVRIALALKDIDYEYVSVGEIRWEVYERINPQRLMPALKIGDQIVPQATAILEYLEETGDPATGLPIGNTRENLAASVAGETHEYTDMYPGMAKTARDEGFEEIAEWFETLAKAEKSHAGRFQKALDTLD